MKLQRRQFLHLAAGAAALPAVSRNTRAQAYPSRPVRIIVPFAAGGGTDITARLIGQWLSDRLGQQFVIENRPGAGTNIGTEVAAKAPADGYPLLMLGTSNAVNPSLYDKLNFNVIRDFVPVGGVIRAPFVLDVNLSMPVKQHVPYRGGGPALLDLIAGQVQVYFAGMPETIEYIRAASVTGLGLSIPGSTCDDPFRRGLASVR